MIHDRKAAKEGGPILKWENAMRKRIVSIWSVALLITGTVFAQAPDNAKEARALIERAVKAHGGAEALARVRADKVKFKGTLVLRDHSTPFVAETTIQLPSKYRHVIVMTVAGEKHTLIYVINGDKLYVTLDGRAVPAEATQLAEIRSGLELERAKRLLPLLEDKGYQLSMADEIKVNERAAVGVRIEGRGRKEMRLFFDKEFGLLVRAENRIDDGKGKEIRQHFFFGDYKEVGGYKRPTKVRAYRDGHEIMQAELLEATPLDEVDETEFAKP
jgi:hypothetical protein